MLYLCPVRNVGEEFAVNNSGGKFYCDLGSYVEWHMYHFKQYEGPEIALFLSLFRTDSCLFDVGTNIGNHAVSFAKKVTSVHGFEPNPAIFRRLESNLALNGARNVLANCFGLGETNTNMTFYAPTTNQIENGANMGTGTFVYEESPALHTPFMLPIRSGDEYVAAKELSRIDGLKIDVQGFEIDVLLGLASTLGRDKPIIWMECSHSTLRRIGSLAGGLQSVIPFRYKLKSFQTSYRWGIVHKTKLVNLDGKSDPPNVGDYLIVPC